MEVRTGARNGSKDPPLKQREGKSRGPNLSGLPSFLRASRVNIGYGSRVSYQLSIDLLFTEQVIRTGRVDSNCGGLKELGPSGILSFLRASRVNGS